MIILKGAWSPPWLISRLKSLCLTDAMLWKKGKDTETVWSRQEFSKIIILIEKQKYGLKKIHKLSTAERIALKILSPYYEGWPVSFHLALWKRWLLQVHRKQYIVQKRVYCSIQKKSIIFSPHADKFTKSYSSVTTSALCKKTYVDYN